MIRIGYFADGPWSHKAIEKIVASDFLEVAFIVPRFESQDPILKQWAEKLSVPYIPCQNVNEKSFIDSISKHNADILVSMSFNQILKTDILELSPLGFINCHAGSLPFYRGRNPLNWALINGESSFGITVHFIDEGIDTGDIIAQKKYPITDSDNYASLLEMAIDECAEVLYMALNNIHKGKCEPITQSSVHPVGTYFGIRTNGDEILNFSWSARRIFNFIRAISCPGPGARFFISEKEYVVESASLIEGATNYIATEGEVVGKSEEGIVVKAGDSTIMFSSIREVDCSEVYIPKFRIGTRLNRSN
jgi:methionyl-tRNA formyltransferase